MWASSASRLCECWLPDERPAPNWVRTVRPMRAAPPVMNGSFAAWLSSWSKQTPRKSRYITSTTGRMPAMAAPTPRPTIAVSEIGRVAHPVAELVVQPAGEAEDVAAGADVDAGDEHPLVGRQLGLERGADGVHRAEHRGVGGQRRRARATDGRARTTKSPSVDARGRLEPAGRLDRAVELARPPTTPAP